MDIFWYSVKTAPDSGSDVGSGREAALTPILHRSNVSLDPITCHSSTNNTKLCLWVAAGSVFLDVLTWQYEGIAASTLIASAFQDNPPTGGLFSYHFTFVPLLPLSEV